MTKGKQAANKRWRDKNLEQDRARCRAYKSAHAEELAAKSRAYYLRHQQARKQAARDYRAAHPKQISSYNRQYAAQNLPRRAEIEARRRARIAGDSAVRGPDSAVNEVYERSQVLRRAGHDVEVDHIVPLAKGGGHVAANLRIITADDNRRKHATLDFIPSQTYYPVAPQWVIQVGSKEELKLAQALVAEHHYLHKPIDARCLPVVHMIRLAEELVGVLIYGRPQAAVCYPFYGSLAAVASGRAKQSRWAFLNLARIYLSPRIQKGGDMFIPNASSQVIGRSLKKIGLDYLVARPPCFLEEPYEITTCLSYCDDTVHEGVTYRASNFVKVRANKAGMQTFMRPVNRLQPHEHKAVAAASAACPRAEEKRLARVATPATLPP